MALRSALLIEDESDLRELMALHLKREGCEVTEAVDGKEGREKALGSKFDILIVDWMLPSLPGVEIVRTLRAGKFPSSTSPILMVTAKTEAADIVLGLEAGADDYLTKPFEIPVLIARVRALLRRSQSAGPAKVSTLAMGDLVMNVDSHEVSCAGKELKLTLYEYKLLSALLQNAGRVLTRAQLITEVQGAGVAVTPRVIDTIVFGLRKKLGDCSELVETIRSIGYRVNAK